MGYAYTAMAPVVVPDQIPDEWPFNWPFPTLPADWTPVWPPGWPKDKPKTYKMTANATDCEGAGPVTLTSRVKKSGTDTSDLINNICEVTATVTQDNGDPLPVQISADNISFHDSLKCKIKSLSGGKWGISQDLYPDFGFWDEEAYGLLDGQTLEFSLSIISVSPTVDATADSNVTDSGWTIDFDGTSTVNLVVDLEMDFVAQVDGTGTVNLTTTLAFLKSTTSTKFNAIGRVDNPYNTPSFGFPKLYVYDSNYGAYNLLWNGPQYGGVFNRSRLFITFVLPAQPCSVISAVRFTVGGKYIYSACTLGIYLAPTAITPLAASAWNDVAGYTSLGTLIASSQSVYTYATFSPTLVWGQDNTFVVAIAGDVADTKTDNNCTINVTNAPTLEVDC